MAKLFQEIPEMPTFDRWVKAFFRYIELVVVCAGLAVAAKKTTSLWLIAPAVTAIFCLILWTFFGVLREVAKTANSSASKPIGTWHIAAALIATIISLGLAYMGTLEMLSALTNLAPIG